MFSTVALAATIILLIFCATSAAAMEAAQPLATATLYPSFHVRPLTNWINDPNFLMRDPSTGIIHVFCQYNDFVNSTTWGNMSIAHMVSTDYVTWQHLPIALHRGPEWYDVGGVFSGSVTFIDDASWPQQKMPVIVYTCVDEEMRQRQCVAKPANTLSSDPLLQQWSKLATNPVIPVPPIGGDFSDFRDPATGFTSKFATNNPPQSSSSSLFHSLHRDHSPQNNDAKSSSSDYLYIPFAAKINGNATIVTYRFTPDLTQASFNNIFYQPTKTFEAMVECPDVFLDPSIPPSQNNNPKRIFLKDSNMDFRQDFYRIGEFLENVQFAETRPDKIFFDFGNFYASKTFFDPIESMRVLLGWINEDGYNGATAAIKTNWAGAQSMPRLVTYNETFRKLQTPPLPALEKLRGSPVVNLGVRVGQNLSAGVRYSVLEAGQATEIGLAHEIVVTLAVKSSSFVSQQSTDFNAGVTFLASSSSSSNAPAFFTSAHINIPSADGSADLNNTDFGGSDILDLPIAVGPNASEQDKIDFCRELCALQPSCVAFTYVRSGFPDPNQQPYDYSPRCSMKGTDFAPNVPRPFAPCCVSGRMRKPRITIDRTNSNSLASTSTIALTRASELMTTTGSNGQQQNHTHLITLRIFVDHSFVEVYHGDGLEVGSTRVYLKDENQNGIQIFSDADETEVVDIRVYPIKSIWK